MSASRARVFVALMLDEARATELSSRVVEALGGPRRAREAYRLPRADGLHLTLHFVGDVPRTALGSLWRGVCARLARLDVVRAPRLAFDGTGAFPARGSERVLWVGVRELEGSALRTLQRSVLRGLADAGHAIQERGAFRPHITVARPRERPPKVPGTFYGLTPKHLGLGEWRPEAVAWVESVRGAGPAEYRVLERFALQPFSARRSDRSGE